MAGGRPVHLKAWAVSGAEVPTGDANPGPTHTAGDPDA